jgi:hypothetical protein
MYREQPPLGTETDDCPFLALLELLFCLLVEPQAFVPPPRSESRSWPLSGSNLAILASVQVCRLFANFL